MLCISSFPLLCKTECPCLRQSYPMACPKKATAKSRTPLRLFGLSDRILCLSVASLRLHVVYITFRQIRQSAQLLKIFFIFLHFIQKSGLSMRIVLTAKSQFAFFLLLRNFLFFFPGRAKRKTDPVFSLILRISINRKVTERLFLKVVISNIR